MVIFKNKNLIQGITGLLLSLCVFSFLSVKIAQAQTPINPEPDISFSVTPEFPQPESSVFISAQSLNTDLGRATFNWKVNGSQFKNGVGVKSINFKTGKIGTGTTVTVSIKTFEGVTIDREFGFRPASVTMIVEAGSYIPPFYKGMPLLSRGGTVRVVAIPEFFNSKGVRLNPKNLTYTWKQNGEVLGELSGYGKDSLTINATNYSRNSQQISVEVFSKESGIAGSNSLSLVTNENKLLLYEDMPALGTMFNHSLGSSFVFNKKELTVVEVPLFMSAGTAVSPLLVTEWTINGATVPVLNNKDRVTLPSGAPGTGRLGVSVRHVSKILQGSDRNLSITIPN